MTLIEKIKQYATRAAATAMLGAALISGGCKSTQPELSDIIDAPTATATEKPKFKPSAWVNTEAHTRTYITDIKDQTLRMIGTLNPFEGGSLLFLLDETASKTYKLDSTGSYLQLQPDLTLLSTPYGKIGVRGMFELGPGFQDRARAGVSITPKIPGMFTQLRVFPLKSGQPGIRIDNFSSAKFLDGMITTDFFASWKEGGESRLYLEPMVKVDIGQATGIDALKNLYAGAILKWSYDFRAGKSQGIPQFAIGYRIKLP